MDELMTVVCQVVADLCDKDVELVKPDEDGDVCFAGDSAAIIVGADNDPPALVFRTFLIEGIKESPALYSLINEINADLTIGQLYFLESSGDVRYYYRYPLVQPEPDVIAYILKEMLSRADHYDDRFKVRLGGQRFFEAEDDEIEV